MPFIKEFKLLKFFLQTETHESYIYLLNDTGKLYIMIINRISLNFIIHQHCKRKIFGLYLANFSEEEYNVPSLAFSACTHIACIERLEQLLPDSSLKTPEIVRINTIVIWDIKGESSTKASTKRIMSQNSNLSSWNSLKGKTFFTLTTFSYKFYMYRAVPKRKIPNFTRKRVFQVIQS